jgi:hypothetical protein
LAEAVWVPPADFFSVFAAVPEVDAAVLWCFLGAVFGGEVFGFAPSVLESLGFALAPAATAHVSTSA